MASDAEDATVIEHLAGIEGLLTEILKVLQAIERGLRPIEVRLRMSDPR
jgi:hypothetical protein